MNYLQFIILLLLLVVAWQDFKFRAIYWWLFPLLICALALEKSLAVTTTDMIVDFAINVTFLTAQLLLLTLYFSIKQQKLVNIFKHLFGLGDLLFLVCIAAYFSIYSYIAYYLLSLLIVLLVTLVWNNIAHLKSLKIPLAGEQAMFLIGIKLVTYFNEQLIFTSDTWLVKHLMN